VTLLARSSSTVTIGVVEKVAAVVTFKGATVGLGAIAPKLKSRMQLVPPLLTVRLLHSHCFVLSAMEMPSVADWPVADASDTALFTHELPTTANNLPALMVVAPL